MSMASDYMIVYHPYGLHNRVANGRADELETIFNHCLAHCLRFHRFTWNFRHKFKLIDYCFAIRESMSLR